MKRIGFSLVELLVVMAILGLLGALVLPIVARAREAASQSACQANLKQLATTLAMYANENKDRYPRMQGDQPFRRKAAGCDLDSYQDRPCFGLDVKSVYPDYLADIATLVCPSGPESSEDNPLRVVRDDGSGACAHSGTITNPGRSYTYLGFFLDCFGNRSRESASSRTAGQLSAVREAIVPALSDGDPSTDRVLDEDIQLGPMGLSGRRLGNGGTESIFRLRCGNGNYFSDPVTRFLERRTCVVPVLWDTVGVSKSGSVVHNHAPGGCNVLYMDGHIESTRYADQFPVSQSFAALCTLSDM